MLDILEKNIVYLKGFLLLPMILLPFGFQRLSGVTTNMTYLVFYVTFILIVGGQLFVTGITIGVHSFLKYLNKRKMIESFD